MKFTVPQELDGITVQNFLRKHCFVSARMLTKLKRVENGITLDGKLIRSIDILHGGDTVKLILPKESVHIDHIIPLASERSDWEGLFYNDEHGVIETQSLDETNDRNEQKQKT